jgi:hypothetical protein
MLQAQSSREIKSLASLPRDLREKFENRAASPVSNSILVIVTLRGTASPNGRREILAPQVAPPQPEFKGRPVVRFIEGTRKALETIYSGTHK